MQNRRTNSKTNFGQKIMTCMWQEERGSKYFKFQTDNPEIAKRMRQRKNFKLVSWGVNCNHWIFQTKFYKPQNARRTLKALTKNDSIKYHEIDEVWDAV